MINGPSQDGNQQGTAQEQSPRSAPTLSLPKGGGAIRGMGEKFAANPVTGTGSMSVPIATSPGRAGFGPQLSLSYDSGAGNGPFGFGWSLSLPSITRKTDKGLPQYLDEEESDVFILSGAEDLVPLLVQSGPGQWVPAVQPPRVVGASTYEIKAYRPRIEGLFAQIERWTNQADRTESFWRSISRDDRTTWYGKTPESRIADPSEPSRIFSWLICESYDDKGNVAAYQYKVENSDELDETQAHERNRSPADRTANKYLKHIRYGNFDPYLPVLLGDKPWPVPAPDKWHFEVVFDYGEHDSSNPAPDVEVAKWRRREDPFSSYRSRFEIRTYRLCQRVLMFHHFANETGVGPDCLVRSTDFTYSQEKDPTDPRNPLHSFLVSVTHSGYKRKSGGYISSSLPPLEFEYTRANLDETVREIDAESLENLPWGLDGSNYQWLDLDGEGAPGILTEQAEGWLYKRNLSPVPVVQKDGSERVEPHFAPMELVAERASLGGLGTGRQQLLDLAGDGQLDAVYLGGPHPGFYKRTQDEHWVAFRPFASLPNLEWDDPNLRFVDLTGDGHADVLITEDDVFCWHPSLAEEGFGPAERVRQKWDEEDGPRLLFSDAEHSIYLVDLNGDGLADLVRIRNGETCFWPNLGYGCFGAKVTMDNSPWFDTQEGFDPRRLHLADLDGSGLTDILYVGREGVTLYFNQAGNRWADGHVLEHFPRVDDVTSLATIDLLGNGTACIVWSSPLPGNVRRQIRYIDLLGGTKPHLLVRSVNNLGAETAITYAPSTKFYLQDKLAGKPWITKLPFPVHVVERVESYDWISRNRFVTRYAYHHGYFDGAEREFRGFGMVEQWDTEAFAALTSTGELPAANNISLASHVPPVHTKSWFHTGVYIDGDHVSNYFAGSLNGQGRGEYFREPAWQDNDIEAARRLLPDTVFPESLLQPDNSRIPYRLTAEEAREACRALKGSMLRQEVYAVDGKTDAENLFTITEQNFALEILQGIGPNRHAVFFAYPREAASYNYERKCGDSITPADPRVVHTLTLDVDLYGNVLRSASVAYGRRVSDLSLPSDEDRTEQTRPHIACSENLFALPAPRPDMWRTPLPYDARTFELTGLDLPPASLRFTFDEVRNAVGLATNIDYEIVPTAGKLQKRRIEHVRTRYRPDDLGVAANDPLALLPLGVVEPLAFAGETYSLAFTPGLLNGIFGARVTDAMLETEGRYVHTAGDTNWWIPSGRVFLSPGEADTATQEFDYAKVHFFLPHRYRDPFHAAAFKTESFVRYDSYNLLTEETRDALGNRTSAGERDVNPDLPLKKRGNDYRVLQAQLLMDPNRNQSAVAFDALGLVVGAATMGKPEDNPRHGDLLQGFDADLSEAVKRAHLLTPLADPHSILFDAASRMVYDLFAYQQTKATANPQPCVVYSLVREIHSADLPPGQKTPVQHSFSYFDGFGREILKKVQAEQGPVPKRDPVTGRIVVQNGLPEMTSADADVRWVGSGWMVFNNKGKPVRQYEPYFSDTHLFEFDVRIGVSPILFYDPLERVVGTLHPNHTWQKEVFDSWRQESFDVSDTVSIPDPQSDADVGDYFNRLPSSEYLPTWYGQRAGGALGPQEQAAAQKAAVHANTQLVTHFDSLGRAFLTVAHNKAKYSDTPPAAPPVEEFFRTRVTFDIEGNQRAVRDAKNRVVMRYDYGMPGNRIHQQSMEAGERWMLNNAAGKPLYAWDSRDHRFRFAYDRLHRPADAFLKEGAGAEVITARNTYGEAQGNAEDNNLRGKLVELRDQTGIASTRSCDFKGNVLRTERQLAHDYSAVLNWAAAVPMDAPVYSTRTRYDALNRPVQIIGPHSNQPGATVNILQRVYNEANLLNQVDAWLNHGAEPTGMLAGATADLHAVTNIAYDAKGQRTQIELGNGVKTTYRYDPFTFRLVSLVTRSAAVDLQNLQYTYDSKGNITHIRDDAQQSVFFRNQRVEPVAEYTYDAIYRLMEATGREHLGQLGGAPVPHSYNDVPRTHILHPGDRNAMGLYLERYVYDVAGNFVEMQHRGTDPANPGWARTYTYGEASLIEATPGNRPTRTATDPLNPELYSVGGNGYDEHGNLLRMPQLQEMRWDFKDQLRMTRRQAVNASDAAGNEHTGERTWYVYDAGGQRVRKVTESSPGVVKEERVYLGAFEIYRKNGVNPIVRETLHIMDDKQRVALIETRTQGLEAGVPQQLIRYQFSNHLGTAALELDDQARVISYEEHTPYGSTAYEAVASQTQTPRRYRFTGKERDEETGFTYHGARYYAPWLGRWTSCDPAGVQSGLNAYEYCRGTPVALIDANGAEPFDPQKGNWFTKALLYNTTPVVSNVLDFATNDRNLKHLQDYYTVVAITAGTIATGGLLEGAAIGLGATAVEAGMIGGFGGGMFSTYATAGSEGRTPTTGEVLTNSGVGALTGGGMAFAQTKVIPAIVARTTAPPSPPPTPRPPAPVLPPAPKPAAPPAVKPAAPAPAAATAPPAAPAPPTPKPPDAPPPGTQLNLFPGEAPAAPKVEAPAATPTGPEIPYRIDMGEVKSENWTPQKAIDYQGTYVFQEGLDLKGGAQASIRYTRDYKLVVDLRELGGMEGPIGKTYVLQLDPAAAQKATAGMKFGTAAYGNALEPLAIQRVGQATGQVPVLRPPQQGGADFLPTQLGFRVLTFTF